MKICQICLVPEKHVPLLKCNHFICPPCYTKIKNLYKDSSKCPFCEKKLIRK